MSEKANYVPEPSGQAPPTYGAPAHPAPVAQQGMQHPHSPGAPAPEIQVQAMPAQQHGTAYPAGPDPAPQMYPPQSYAPAQPQPSQYPTAIPLHGLQRTPQVVDCPACGQREMTRAEAVNGNSTQYVYCLKMSRREAFD
ncbi:hypothetical protein BDW75DRAFT_239044 [Aspergillus navahoensis]